MTNATWAGRSATPPTPENNEERAGWIPVASVIAALGLVGAGGFLLGTSNDSPAEAAPLATIEESAPTIADDEDSAETTAAPSTTAQLTTAPSTTASPTTAPSTTAPSTTAPSTTAANEAAPDDAGQAETANQVVIEEGEVRGAVLRNGVLYLGGTVPSREIADQIIGRAAAVVGEDNIVDEYVIDLDAEMGQGAPLYIDDVVLFAYGESTFDPQFEPLLDLGLLLLSQNPSVVITIVTHTDADGPSSFNDRLSLQRGQYLAQYWLDRGVPVSQISIDARGERDPRADNHTDEGAQLNRRAEFYIAGLLP